MKMTKKLMARIKEKYPDIENLHKCEVDEILDYLTSQARDIECDIDLGICKNPDAARSKMWYIHMERDYIIRTVKRVNLGVTIKNLQDIISEKNREIAKLKSNIAELKDTASPPLIHFP